jgi:putative transcriptional regulator
MCLREKIGPDPRNFNQRVSLGRNDLLIRTFSSMFGWRQSRISNYENGTRKPNLNDCRRIVEKFNEPGLNALDSVFPPILP